jgi:hypothetical protein
MIKINMGLPPEVARAPDAAAMKTLPGLPTMAALMLSALITVWLGLWGPIDIQKLKDWQPLMASIIAPTIVLGAATLAYLAAMAKVNHDRQEAVRQRNRERLGLFLRLRASLWRVMFEARKSILALDDAIPPLRRLD